MAELGRGAFTHVIEHPEKKNVAIKIIDVDSQRPPHNWRAEVAALHELAGQKHIVRMLAYEESRKTLDHEVYIQMPRLVLTLENVVFHFAKASYPPGSGWRNAMPFRRLAEIMYGLCDALQAVHNAGIIHRDIKPENVLFDSVEGRPVLIDFGIAWVPHVSSASEPESNRVTDVSTGEYKAPELLFGVVSYTNKIDLWALGCILARMLGPDCKPLFTPYRSDIALIGAQLQTLGAIDLANCPTLNGPVAQAMVTHLGASSAGPGLRLGRLGPQAEMFVKLAYELLDYEPSRRPSAKQLCAAIASMLNE